MEEERNDMKRQSGGALIEYLHTQERWLVRVDGITTGEIRPVKGGWQYFPKGQKTGGEIFLTLGEVKHSLEGD